MDIRTPGRQNDTLLLLGLPASGKSVIRHRLSTIASGPDASVTGVGPTIQLDDFPYVHFMWLVDEALAGLGYDRVFYDRDVVRFLDARHFTTLTHLLDEDYAALDADNPTRIECAGHWIIDRLSRARARSGMASLSEQLGPEHITAAARAIEGEATVFAGEWSGRRRPRDGTVVIEFARGGPEGALPPLAAPFGYAHALSRLSPALLARAAVLYVWVTPQESRARNRRRATQGAEGSTLAHAVPEPTMRECYGVDDMEWLIESSGRPGTIEVRAHGSVFYLPVARVDNRGGPRSSTDAHTLDAHLDRVLLEALSESLGRAAEG